eukprot:CAMPEP_0178757298 /NCGR_PEP_ID=MMETSP0744-20121128/13748_1 /TAXON_ID=913974 /ORGANISM="Nitzschia punctata, Strain CCMP561" /LENGTH=47 /DNA_ID= /DNA_START= /DNA_END= /DNA_ORIENTATION=
MALPSLANAHDGTDPSMACSVSWTSSSCPVKSWDEDGRFLQVGQPAV